MTGPVVADADGAGKLVQNADQASYWNGPDGQKWADHQADLDATFAPVLNALMTAAQLQPGMQVLDVGCGSGESCVLAASHVGQSGHVLGLDVSEPLIELAKKRTQDIDTVSFLVGDAAVQKLPSETYDVLMSRFGVMFFDDPGAAFGHLRASLKPNGRIALATWGRIDRNPWFTYSAQAARSVLGQPPKVDPDGPGPFSMRDPNAVTEMLAAAGFVEVCVDVQDISLTPKGRAQDAAETACHIGPAARTLDHFDADATAREIVADRIKDAFQPFETATDFQIPAEINFITAKAP